ncbi:YndJ family protein [Sporosarcina sp. ACRSM]|uniref:YndJ family protein n=1 Tax=Sporosarcina sp. ACRSM TaxID=2918216 RepID=UPI001EF3FF4F|nr:YndJ family protein [Sporosarcina sp. ACRSM]MCG7335912.1 YndJ family protein [Sporosarcina sp. ACRSM]
MLNRNFLILYVVLFLGVAYFSVNPWPSLMLTVAQLVYVPIALRLIVKKDDWFTKCFPFIFIPAYMAVVLLQLTASAKWEILLATVYLSFTVVVALYGLSRFFNRGFTHMEEFAIDIGLIYLSLGGAWFFAYVVGIDTGFSPLITWLTAIHFHYSSFLLPLFIGLLGRIYKPAKYSLICLILIVAPMVVAIGITFSKWLELLSVLLYIIGIGGLIGMAWKAPFAHKLQQWLVRISFSALGVTIIFSLLYALGNGFGLTSVNIDFMLRFHGLLNCVLFALLGILGWSLAIPTPTYEMPHFPISTIRGKWVVGEQVLNQIVNNEHRGLVDDMQVYGHSSLPPRIIDFYENTKDYRLVARVKWQNWFKPFAFLYTLASQKTQQINLPFHDDKVEMTGNILALQDDVDGRDHVRAWVRKIEEDTVFVALYSQHQTAQRTYMNIALPLPLATMTGILELNQIGDQLQLTSRTTGVANSDAGIYLTFRENQLFKLPIEENFLVHENPDGTLRAEHQMWIFAWSFLTIDYWIERRAD